MYVCIYIYIYEKSPIHSEMDIIYSEKISIHLQKSSIYHKMVPVCSQKGSIHSEKNTHMNDALPAYDHTLLEHMDKGAVSSSE